ncbi:unnamed protein product [Agarophyton chilense]
MKLSLDRELVYLAHAETLAPPRDTPAMAVRQQRQPSVVHGFTTIPNDGVAVFRPILPGTYVPPARQLVDAEPVESPLEGTDDPESLPLETSVAPAVTDIDVPIFTPPVEQIPTDPNVPVPTQLPIAPSAQPFEPVTTSPPRDVTFTPAPTDAPVAPVLPGVPGVAQPVPAVDASVAPLPDAPAAVDPTDAPVTDSTLPTDAPVSAFPSEDAAQPVGGVDGEVSFPSDTVEPEASPEDDAVCFPAHATVQLDDGSVKSMASVNIGDRVLVAPETYSPVFMFTHKLADVRHSFVHLHLSSGHQLSLTRGHYLYVNGHLSAASTVNNGDTLKLADASFAQVTRVSSVDATGLFNPQTVHGDIVVNGVLASTYTTAVKPNMAHAFLAPLRAAYSRLGMCLTAFEAGADTMASYLPSGAVVN